MSATTKQTAKEFLTGMVNDTTICTTRGTTGDAACELVIDDDIINEFNGANVETLVDCSNDDAKGDLVDWVKRNCPNTELSDYGVLVKNNQYLLVW